MRNLTSLSNEQIETLFDETFNVLVNLDEAYGPADITFTTESLSDFEAATAQYASHGALHRGVHTGFEWLVIESAQLRAGDARRDVRVLDLGAVRAVFQ